MISNYVLEQKILLARNRHSELVNKKNEIVVELKNLGLTENQKYKLNNGSPMKHIPEEIKNKRKLLSHKMIAIEKEITPIKNELSNLHRQKDAEKNKQLMNIFKEVFTQDQIIEIKTEAERRMNGEPPFKMSFSLNDSIELRNERNKYKRELIKQLDAVIGFRIKLTQLIDKGCEQFGKSEFLQFVSPLNRQIIPVKELEEIKRKIIG